MTNDQLLSLASKYPAPQEWYDEDDLPLVAAGYLHDTTKHYTPFDDGCHAFTSDTGDNGASFPLTSGGTGLRSSVPSFIDRHITAVFVAIVLGGVGVWILWIRRAVQG